jgi:cyanophycin synthetase
MEFRKVLALRGPNIWANFPVLEAWVDLGALKDSPSDSMPGFNERLMGWLPSMIEHRCSVGERGGFFERLRRGTYLAHILEHVTLELQTLSGCEVGFGRARESLGEGYYKVAIEYEVEELARAAFVTGRELCMAAVEGRDFDVHAEVAKLRAIYQKHCLGPSTKSIVRAAMARDIPWRRLNEGSADSTRPRGQAAPHHRRADRSHGRRRRRDRARQGTHARVLGRRGRAGAARSPRDRRRRRLGSRRRHRLARSS